MVSTQVLVINRKCHSKNHVFHNIPSLPPSFKNVVYGKQLLDCPEEKDLLHSILTVLPSLFFKTKDNLVKYFPIQNAMNILTLNEYLSIWINFVLYFPKKWIKVWMKLYVHPEI